MEPALRLVRDGPLPSGQEEGGLNVLPKMQAQEQLPDRVRRAVRTEPGGLNMSMIRAVTYKASIQQDGSIYNESVEMSSEIDTMPLSNAAPMAPAVLADLV